MFEIQTFKMLSEPLACTNKGIIWVFALKFCVNSTKSPKKALTFP